MPSPFPKAKPQFPCLSCVLPVLLFQHHRLQVLNTLHLPDGSIRVIGNVDPARLLNYGATGLGFLLAFLAYLLLRNEQKNPKPRAAMIRAIYTFMIFASLLGALGFATEMLKSRFKSGPCTLTTVRTGDIHQDGKDNAAGVAGGVSQDDHSANGSSQKERK